MIAKPGKHAKKAVASESGYSPHVYLTIKIGDNELEVSGSEDYVTRMRDWFMELQDDSKSAIKDETANEEE